MKILLTGGTGMVGLNIREHDCARKYEIFAPDRSELDLMDGVAVFDFLNRIKPDLVIHAAGKVGGIQANISEPTTFLSDNLTIGMNVVLAARQAKIPRLLNLGSSCMYPRNAPNPLAETSILTGELEPTNEGYAIAKIACAKLCEYITRENPAYSYKTVIPCNLYGRHDKFDLKKAHMIPSVIRRVAEAVATSANKISIWGDGTARREFMYAGDFASFVFYSVDNFDRMPPVMNVGLGHDFSIIEYYREIAGVVGFVGDFEHDLSKPSGMKQKLVDVTLLQNFGWQPQISLRAGIALTFDYYKTEHKHD